MVHFVDGHCYLLIINRTGTLKKGCIASEYSKQFAILRQDSAKAKQSTELQYSMFQQFVQRITWEFDYSYDCNDENDTFL